MPEAVQPVLSVPHCLGAIYQGLNWGIHGDGICDLHSKTVDDYSTQKIVSFSSNRTSHLLLVGYGNFHNSLVCYLSVGDFTQQRGLFLSEVNNRDNKSGYSGE